MLSIRVTLLNSEKTESLIDEALATSVDLAMG